MIRFSKLIVCTVVSASMSFGSLQAQYEYGTPAESHLTQPTVGCKANCGDSYFTAEQCAGCCYNNCCYDDCGRYFRAFGGWNWLDSLDTEAGTALVPGDAEFNDGWGVGGAFGKYITPLVRRELEFSYRHNSASEFNIPAVAAIPLDGNIRSYSIMGNLIREFGIANPLGLIPYLGGGLGIVFVDGNMTGGGDTYSIDQTAFGYQGFVGMNRQISARAKAFAEYRYLGTSNIDIVGPVATTTDRYSAHNLFFGLQFHR